MVKDNRINRPKGTNITWPIHGDVSKNTLNAIYFDKEVEDDIIGIFVCDSNKVLIMSNQFVKELDRGFFRTKYKFNKIKYEDITEIQRRVNCFNIKSFNRFNPNKPPTNFCLKTEATVEKAIEMILEKSNLENVIILPDIETMKQIQREDKRQHRIEKRKKQWEERQRTKRHVALLMKGEQKNNLLLVQWSV
ncbi:MAG: hypothetical protein HeimC2_31190 [Candidatus Heimdallarchaeota archaeon LC_2]|nr:MAG: hypothetical protein HeimC2_31190 [Candidatus Heimdallarchaeota archaeon LC_2]